MRATQPERLIEANWGEAREEVFPVDVVIEAMDRQGLLRDISEVFSKEKINVTAANTLHEQPAFAHGLHDRGAEPRCGQARIARRARREGCAGRHPALALRRTIPRRARLPRGGAHCSELRQAAARSTRTVLAILAGRHGRPRLQLAYKSMGYPRRVVFAAPQRSGSPLAKV